MLDTATHVSIASVIANRMITSVYQPIVDLSTREIVGYEALARGPKGTSLEHPDALFAAADRSGVRAALDWECRASALRGAIEAGIGHETCLFINLEATTFGLGTPAHLAAEIEEALTKLNVIAEITERDLLSDPASLMHGLGTLRGLGFGVAIDDLGANPAPLALLPFLEPDIIKLDMGLIQRAPSRAVAATAAAVRSDAERRGALVIAEGIETEEHLDRARVLGAGYGQGWLFGRPGPLESRANTTTQTSSLWANLSRDFHPAPATPWDLVSDSARLQVASKEILLPMSMLIEQHPVADYEPPVILAAFQHARNFTGDTALRYSSLANRAAFVGVLGEQLGEHPVPGVRGGTIEPEHSLSGEWTVVSIGPHYAAALIAKDLGDGGPEHERRFEYVITHDRSTVISAATALLRLIQPAKATGRRSTDN